MMTKDTLIIHQGALGDLILTLTAVRRVLPGRPAAIFCRSAFIPLLRHLSLAGRVLPVDDIHFSRLYEEAPSGPTADMFRQYRRILLFSSSTRLRENLEKLTSSTVHMIPPRPEPARRIHVVDFLVQRLTGLIGPCGGAPPAWSPATVEAHRGPKRRILIHPGSGSRRKNWPLENFIHVYRALHRRSASVRWVLGPAEAHMAQALKNAGVVETDVYSNDDLIRFCRRLPDADLFLGNDGGLGHLAAFLGTPVMAIFGPSDPVRWRPVGADVTVLSPNTACAPCFETEQHACDRPACFDGITAYAVLEMLKNRSWV